MSETPFSDLTPSTACFNHLVGLKHAMAGDMESVDALETLMQRMVVIQWDDPAFIQFSEEMRAGLPKLTPEQEKALEPSLRELVSLQTEMLARHSEGEATRTGALKLAIDKLKVAMEDQKEFRAQMDQIIAYTKKLLDLNQAMRDRMQMLGADTSEFQPPKLDL